MDARVDRSEHRLHFSNGIRAIDTKVLYLLPKTDVIPGVTVDNGHHNRPSTQTKVPHNNTFSHTSQLGGFTLTTTLLYLSISLHARNRVYQSALLHQQSLILTNLVEPLPPLPPPTSREVRAGILETAKDRWNAELEREVKALQNVDWNNVRERMEEGVSKVYRRAFEKGREVAPDPPK